MSFLKSLEKTIKSNPKKSWFIALSLKAFIVSTYLLFTEVMTLGEYKLSLISAIITIVAIFIVRQAIDKIFKILSYVAYFLYSAVKAIIEDRKLRKEEERVQLIITRSDNVVEFNKALKELSNRKALN